MRGWVLLKTKHSRINYILPKMECVFYVLIVDKNLNKNFILHNKTASVIS
ncbi:hypothetical protein BACI71_90201 [Bacillus mycoides]|uniref:Uncharacterized protein n=1 Tax=Bacillus mycoides TaxID=1405 RepID=A0A654CCA3_BACMY|nr:hypothetical protein BACI71_90201 [Bacillus mycoides]